MSSDAIDGVSLHAFAKKKKGGKLEKMKQRKIDLRRKQRLSPVKSKSYKPDTNGVDRPLPSPIPVPNNGKKALKSRHASRKEEHEIPRSYDTDPDSWSSSNSFLHSVLSKGSRSSSSSSTSCSGSVSGEERDDGCLDDWEAIADALTSEEPVKSEHIVSPDVSLSGAKIMKTGNSRAWTHDDAFRPRTLPSLSRQQLPIPNSVNWQSLMSEPLTCPICCEDLDTTDSRFLPCPCGFRLCLFCHKRILEADGRCPGCRKQYGSVNVSSGLFGEGVAL